MYVVAIIAAGGRGERLGGGAPKQLLEIAGRPMLQWTLDAFTATEQVDEIVVVIPRELAASPPRYLQEASKTVRAVAGGERRQDSVARGFALVPNSADIVVVHDAARPLVTPALIARTIEAAVKSGAAIAALPAHDTVKRGICADGIAFVSATLPRESIFLAQTPQAFRREILNDAITVGRDAGEVTDEAMLAERAGHQVRLVHGDARNIKVTSTDDLALAETLLAQTVMPDVRAGTGYDLHRLEAGRTLILGGVTIPFDAGLSGHSDADALCHAVTDAILGAAGAGDIGRHFPNTDPQWKHASSIDLLQKAVEIVRARGYRVDNIDAVVIAERPKLEPYLEQIRARLGHAIDVDPSRVSVKGKTNEGVGEIGRGEAIAVHAIALVRKI